ncbi:MAG TPA: class I SAM-dependent methyltransferase [Vicinamibacterales bacterium]
MPEPNLADWLALREAADHAARSETLTRALASSLPAARPLRILDLGTGTGSNIRFLASRLPAPQAWTATDRDPSLLARVPAGVETRCMELGSLDDQTLFGGIHLVTASALLDLVSPEWIAQLAERCRLAGASVLFALNYNGWSACTPSDPDDGFVLKHFNRHQRANDKGFGCAAGPEANAVTARSFAERGYEVRTERSDWSLTPELDRLQTSLIEGWAHATSEIVPDETGRLNAWLERRLLHVRLGRSRIMVGHEDVAAWPVRSPE